MEEKAPEHLRKVFIGGLSAETTDDSLRDYFSKYGDIVDCVVMKDAVTKRSRGFGFVAFDRPECVDELQNERPHELDGKEVDTKRVIPKQASGSGPVTQSRDTKVKKVFVGGLRDAITEDDLRSTFAQFGGVEKVETYTDRETGKRKGFAFVTFYDHDCADKCTLHASTQVDGKLNIQGHKVEVKKAVPQGDLKGNRGGGGRGGGFGGRGRGGGGGGFNDFRSGRSGGFGDFNQGYGGGQGGYNNGGGYGGGGGGGYNNGGFGSGDGGYSSGYNNGGNFGGGGSGGYGGGNSGGYGGGNSGGYGGGNSGGYGGGGNSGGYGSGYGGGAASGGGYGQNAGGGGGGGSYGSAYGNSSGGGPMRGGFNKPRSGPYGGGGGGGARY